VFSLVVHECVTGPEAAGPTTLAAGLATLPADSTLWMANPCSAYPFPTPPVSVTKFDLNGLALLAASSHISMADSDTKGLVSRYSANVTSFDLASVFTFAKGSPILMVQKGPAWYLSRTHVYMTGLRGFVPAGLVIIITNIPTLMTYPCLACSLCRIRVCVVGLFRWFIRARPGFFLEIGRTQ